MPTVAVVDGIQIRFYLREHPPPHFHAIFGEHRLAVEIETLRSLKGTFPVHKLKALLAWAEPRREKLFAAWYTAQKMQKPGRIE
ncbi:DUF4160 domain-containing protein [Salinarimonas chemoclinalis]|uniref:DUF4160 domain-containing protein n=1 Tax=Salinarimonas chemoclinalis TaxID=3241599 RepID=UPI003557C756